ncbi:LysR family transcriptional regulator [Cereibacter sp. SYSU M97828]|nr:LysR family transcriptional regulator [Cereibacter flavus]
MRHGWNNRIKLRHLRTVLAVVDCGGTTAAAAQLSVSQAAISKTIAEVEVALETKIFRRQGRALLPTPAGERLIDAARKISVQINNLGEELDLLAQGGSGVLRVGLQAVTAHDLFIRAAARIGVQHPGAQIQMREGHMAGLVQDLLAGRLDLIFGRLIPSVVADLPQMPLLHTDASVVVASLGHPVLSGPAPRWPDLISYPWVLPLPETPLRLHFDRLVAAQLVGHLRCVFETTSPPSILGLLQATPLLALVPVGIAKSWTAQSLVASLDFTIQPQSEPLGLVWAPDGEHLPLLRLFRSEIAGEALRSPLCWRGPDARPAP